jgi:hypothetical protein
VHALADLGDFSSEFDVAEYLWAEGYEVFAAAYLDHCLSILVAETRAHENGEMDEDRRAIRSVRGCCRRAVEILAGRRGRSRRHGIGAFSPVVARARRLVEKYECAELFRPSRWVPSQPAGDLMSSAPASRSTRTRTARDRGVQPFAPRRLIMNPESDRMRIVPTNASGETPDKAPKKRFRIEKIEERIAPGGHYNPQSKWVGGSTPSGADSSASGSISIVSGTSY